MPSSIQLKQQFRSIIRRGTGEAYLLIHKHPGVDFSNEISKACIKNYAYAAQCERDRASYLFGLIELSDQKKIRSRILSALATEQDGTWSLQQLFDLAKFFALQGDSEAKQAIYDRFYTNIIDGSDWLGYYPIIEIDGLDGLLFVADRIGQVLEEKPNKWQSSVMIDHFQKKNPEIDTRQALAQAAIANSNIRRYLDSVEETDQRWANPERRVFDNIIDEVLAGRRLYPTREVSYADLRSIAERLLTEKNKKNREKLLRVFAMFKFPLDSKYLLNIARSKGKSDKTEVWFAVMALSFFSGDEIRDFALNEAAKNKNPAGYLTILVSNYKAGDAALLTNYAEKATNEDVMERLAIAYIDIYQENETPECKQPLEAIYARLTCSLHRQGVVQILIDNNVLSDRIREELKFDCNESIRELV